MDEREDQPKLQRDEVRVATGVALEEGDKIVAVARRRVDPHDGERREDRADRDEELQPVTARLQSAGRLAGQDGGLAPFLVLPRVGRGVLADHRIVRAVGRLRWSSSESGRMSARRGPPSSVGGGRFGFISFSGVVCTSNGEVCL